MKKSTKTGNSALIAQHSALWAGLVAIGFTFAMCGAVALAQEAHKIRRIGYLSASSASEALVRINPFRRGLQELGYIEGKNLVLEFRYAEGKFDRLPALAAELVRLNVDIIVSAGPSVTGPAKEATNTIPIVMTNDADPVGSKFVASLAHPGGNCHGPFQSCPRIERQASGTFKRGRTQAFPAGDRWNVRYSGERISDERDRAGRNRFQSANALS